MIDRQAFQMRQRSMPDEYAGFDKLMPGSLRGAEFAIVTIADVVTVDAKRGEDKRTGEASYEPSVILIYDEFPKRIHWLNKMAVNILCDVFGEDEKEWKGKQIPIVIQQNVKNPKTSKREDMVWVANADEWTSLFDQDEVQRATTTATPAKAPADNTAARAAREAAEKRAAKKAAPQQPQA